MTMPPNWVAKSRSEALFFYENLSRRLVAKLEDLYPGSTHAVLAGLGQRPDREIWEFARRADMVVVSADADFYELATVLGPPPKFLWLQGCDYPTRVAENLLRGQAVRIARFVEDADQAVLILRPQ